MSLGDTLAEAVDAIDADLREGFGAAWSGATYHPLIVATRDQLELVRCLVDADAMGAPADKALRGFRPIEWADPEAEEADEDGD